MQPPIAPAARRVAVLPCATALIAFAAAGCSGDAKKAPAGPPTPVVTVAKPLVQPIVEWDRYTGRLVAVESIEVRARVSGYLQSIHFDEGTDVEPGQLLFVIDPRPFEAERAKAEAAITEAEARRRRAEAQNAQAAAARNEARSQRELADQRLARAEAAARTNAIASEEVDVRRSEARQAGSLVEAAEAAVASAEADIASVDAAIESARVALQRAELDLSYTRITAPIGGRISDVLVTRGNLVEGGGPSATMLTRIVSADPIHVEFDANEKAYLKYARLSRSGKGRVRASSRTRSTLRSPTKPATRTAATWTSWTTGSIPRPGRSAAAPSCGTPTSR